MRFPPAGPGGRAHRPVADLLPEPSNFSGSARRDVRMSTSTAVQPPIAVSSRSTAVKSVPVPVPILIWPPRSLVTTYVLFSMRSSRTPRCAESVVMSATLALAFLFAVGERPGQVGQAAVAGHRDAAGDHTDGD